MEIWLAHETHGIKCAHLPTEAENDEKNGWVRFDPFARGDIVEPSNVAPYANGDEQPKKRGRPTKYQG